MRRLAFAFLLTVSVSAQVTETIDVAITSIDVVVTDGKGNRVRGLTRSGFEIYENGHLREITNFTEYAAAPQSSQVAAAPATDGGAAPSPVAITPPRRLMIVFDANTLTATHRRNATAAAASFIEEHMRPTDKATVAVLSQQFVPRLDWTSDRAALQRVIREIGSETALNTIHADLKRAEDRIESLIELAASTVGTTAKPPTFSDLMDVARVFAERSLQDTRAAASLLGNVVTQFGKLPEKKALIFIGEGLDARPGWELFQMLEGLTSGARHSPGVEIIVRSGRSESPLIEAGRYSAAAAFSSLATTAYRSGVPIYAINPGTNEDVAAAIEKMAEPADRIQDFAKFASKFMGYDLVATYSGGAAFAGQRADLALNQVAADIGAYYSIGFRASAAPKVAGAIRVRMKRGYRVRASLATAAPVELADAMNEAVTAHHLGEPSTNELEIDLEAGERVTEGAKQKVKLSVTIPMRNLELAPQGNEVTGGFDVYLSVSDGKGYFSPVIKQTHAIRWPADEVTANDERTMAYTIDVTVESGTSQISVGVVDQVSQRTGFARTAI